MDKIVPFNKGIHRQPSLGEDGELSELVNLIPRNGELVNVRDMKPYVAGVSNDEVFLGIHKVAIGDVLLFSAQDAIKFYTSANGELTKFAEDIRMPSKVNGMEVAGNIVALITNDGDYFLQYKNGGYLSQGSGYPELPISFGLKSAFQRDTVSCYGLSLTMTKVTDGTGYYGNFIIGNTGVLPDDGNLGGSAIIPGGSNSFQYSINSGITEINETISSNIERVRGGDDKFVYPFLVRCAYKTNSNNYVRITPPVLMMCTTGSCAYVSKDMSETTGKFTNNNLTQTTDVSFSNNNFNVDILAHELFFTFYEDIDFDNWADLISSMDIFISDEFAPSSESIENATTSPGFIKTSYACVGGAGKESQGRTNKWDFVALGAGRSAFWEPSVYMGITEDRLKEAQFKLYRSYTLDELKELKNKSGGTLKGLNVVSGKKDGETIDDLEEEKDVLASRNIVAYNNRFVKVGDVKRYYEGVDVRSAFPLLTKGAAANAYYYVRMVIDGVSIIVGGEANEGVLASLSDNGTHYFFYPSTDAKEVFIRLPNGHFRKYDLTSSDWQAGAFFFDSRGDRGIIVTTEPEVQNNVTGDRSIIRFSNVDDPSIFDEKNKLQVSFGDILNIATSAKALSQGQFGQFPLYAFCTDGIWALSVDEEGKFDSNQPISRDVCNNPDSVTQIDGAVVFTTDQGLMLIQGSDVVCLSDVMNGNNINERDFFFHSGFFAEQSPDDIDRFFDDLVIPETRDFREILKTCRIAYDYVNKMLRIFPKENTGKYYVFSLESREFASVIPIVPYGDGETSQATTLDVKSVVAGYPSSIVQLGEALYTPSEVDDNNYLKIGLLLTRPISMNEPFAMKKLKDLKLYYSKFDGTSKCKVVVYVSNDGAKWEVLKSLHKCSYKYYCFAICTRMKDMDALSGMALRYELERTNKLR